MKIAICDDDKAGQEKVRCLAADYFDRSGTAADMVCFSSGQALLESVGADGPYAIYLLDILMPEMDGISLGERLRAVDPDGILIYLTSSGDYYPDAFRVYAFQYLLKPVSGDALSSVLERAVEHVREERASGEMVRTASGTVFVPFSRVIYIEQLNRMLHYHLSGGEEVQSLYIRASFGESVGTFLEDRRFVRTHRAFLVNLDRVRRVETQSFSMEGGARVPLSRTYADEAKSRYIQRLMDRKKSSRREV